MKMTLTYSDFKNGHLLFRGKVAKKFYYNNTQIFELENGKFFQRKDYHILPIVGFSPEVEIYRIEGDLVLVYLINHNYTYIESIKVIESKTIEPFTGFESNKIYKLQNGQSWRQIGGPYAPNHHSSGFVKIINDNILLVDNWTFYPKVVLET